MLQRVEVVDHFKPRVAREMIHATEICQQVKGEVIAEISEYLHNGILSDDKGNLLPKHPGIQYIRCKSFPHLLNQCSFRHGFINRRAWGSKLDGFVKSPSAVRQAHGPEQSRRAALRCILRQCSVLLWTPHSSGFAWIFFLCRLIPTFYQMIKHTRLKKTANTTFPQKNYVGQGPAE